MPELVNTFSWSLSAADDFSECRRRRYWAKYAMWGGWKEQASPLQKTAYRLSKMDNRYALIGRAVELAVVWALRELQAGRAVAVEDAYVKAARPYLNQCWSDSKKQLWRAQPKRHCCLHEHYYPQFHTRTEPEMTKQMIDQVKVCVGHFLDTVWPRLSAVRREDEVAIATPETGGDPESFPFDNVKIYAIPDYAYRRDGQLHIHDWKSGNPKPEHKLQMGIYGLWAHVRHGLPIGQIHVHLEYLLPSRVESATLTDADVTHIQQVIRESVGEMTEYLDGGDLRRNQPLPQDQWELAADTDLCRHCNFYELCKPELDAG